MLTNLPHRVSIQSVSAVEDEGGAYIETWTTTQTVWANVQLKAQETNIDNKTQQENAYDIIIRKTNITNANRILYNNEIIHIETVIDGTQRGKMMRLIGRRYV